MGLRYKYSRLCSLCLKTHRKYYYPPEKDLLSPTKPNLILESILTYPHFLSSTMKLYLYLLSLLLSTVMAAWPSMVTYRSTDIEPIERRTDLHGGAQEIDVERAQKAKDRADQLLKSNAPEVDYARAEDALHRAENRLSVAKEK